MILTVIKFYFWKKISYDYFNPFELLHWHELGALAVWGPALAVAIASLFVYRPFCTFVCPLGLITWFFSRDLLGLEPPDSEQPTADCSQSRISNS